MQQKLVIATRKSQLALWQAEHIKQRLEQLHPHLTIELLGLSTKGDEILDKSLAKIGGKGLFIKELEQALLDKRADIAVHSMKDMPAELPEGLVLSVICERAAETDAFVSNHYQSLEQLPNNARLGTSSLRRQCQIKALRPDLEVVPLRGNVNTRLKKLDDGEFDAICLATSGLQRLGMGDRIAQQFPVDSCIPAVGQGALGIECRAEDHATIQCLDSLNHTPTWQCVMAERRMNQILGGSCQTPVAGHARIENGELTLVGMVGEPDGSHCIRYSETGKLENFIAIGEGVAQGLLAQGATSILDACR